VNNDFSACAPYYDIIQDVKEFEQRAAFAVKLLKQHNVKSVLELGCGTGLYLFPLQKAGFTIEGLDISKGMLDLARKKGKVVLHQKDMSSFNLHKQFDAVLCMNTSLLYLPDWTHIEKTLATAAKHLKPNGLFLLDLPNIEVEMEELDGREESFDYRTPDGKLSVLNRDRKEDGRWKSDWIGSIKGKQVFHETYSEYIYSPQLLEKALKKHFTILKVYGSPKGAALTKSSWRRFYVCQN